MNDKVMVKRIRQASQSIIAASRRLRLNPTPAEERLWDALKQRQLNGLKFRRQHPIGAFIVDFYCPQCGLMIEVDGDSHNQQLDYDAARTLYLNQLGYRVLRFRNEEIFNQLDQVLKQIEQATQESTYIHAPNRNQNTSNSQLPSQSPPAWGI